MCDEERSERIVREAWAEAWERIEAAIKGEVSRDELDADLLCAVNAVAVMDACYESNQTGGWVDVASV